MKPNKEFVYLDQSQFPYIFCPGCGHSKVIDHLDKALKELSIDPHKIVIVTDIGCAGLSDRYFLTNTFHGLHGRSITYATGIKLANPELKVIVLIGDGGCGIGGHHLLNASRRNIGITTIVFNNLNYGMTGGEHSVTTPLGSQTSTTPLGQLEVPMDICGTVIVNGATFVARSTTFDQTLYEIMREAIGNDGFSLVDVWELCTAHFASRNRLSRLKLTQTMESLSMSTGILKHKPRTEYSLAYRKNHLQKRSLKPTITNPIPIRFCHSLKSPFRIILAGSAGSKIVSAATLFSEGAIRSNLFVSQRNDYPVTVKSGYSLSEIIISPKEIRFTGIDKPDLVIVLSQEGLERSKLWISKLTESETLFTADDLPEIMSKASRKKIKLAGQKKELRAIIALTYVLSEYDLFPLASFREAIYAQSNYAQENLFAFEAGVSMRGSPEEQIQKNYDVNLDEEKPTPIEPI